MTAEHDTIDRDAVWRDFNEAVNMTPSALSTWLDSEDSRAVGWTHEGDTEAVGHREGRRILDIKATRKADLADDDWLHMRKVVGYVHRHLAQGGPKDDPAHSRWRFSLMNWGHDPLKDRS